MARLYANENFPFPVVAALRRFGHDVLTIQETGRAGQSVPDNMVLDLASVQERAVLTLNRKHFVRLHGRQTHHAGIVVCTFDRDFEGQATRIHQAIESQGQLGGKLIRVNRPSNEEETAAASLSG